MLILYVVYTFNFIMIILIYVIDCCNMKYYISIKFMRVVMDAYKSHKV